MIKKPRGRISGSRGKGIGLQLAATAPAAAKIDRILKETEHHAE